MGTRRLPGALALLLAGLLLLLSWAGAAGAHVYSPDALPGTKSVAIAATTPVGTLTTYTATLHVGARNGIADLPNLRASTAAGEGSLRHFVIAAEAEGVGSTTTVIDGQADTTVAEDWPGDAVVDLPANEWTLAKND